MVKALWTVTERKLVAALPFVFVVSSADDVDHFPPKNVVKDARPDNRRE